MTLKHGSNRRDDGGEFPAGLVVIGLVLVAIVWVGLIRPDFLDFLPFKSPPTPSAKPPSAVMLKERVTVPQDLHAPESDPVQQEATADKENSGGMKGEFYRYTDEEGTIHLVDNPANVPEKYRQQTKVYNSHTLKTQVRIVRNQVLVPVTLRNGYQEVRATLLLDTGCTTTSISTELAARLQIDPARTRAGTARVADGRKVPSRIAVIDQLSIGLMSKNSLAVSIMPTVGPKEMADGLLGMNFLGDFRYQIDTEKQQIIWH